MSHMLDNSPLMNPPDDYIDSLKDHPPWVRFCSLDACTMSEPHTHGTANSYPLPTPAAR